MLDKAEEGFVASYDKLSGVFEQVLDGCAHLRRMRMSHGDIKPPLLRTQSDFLEHPSNGCVGPSHGAVVVRGAGCAAPR